MEHAFSAAKTAQRQNMHRTPQELAQPILEAINVILANSQDIASLIVAESGSTINHMRHFEEAMKKIRPLSTQELNMYEKISDKFGKPDDASRRRNGRESETGLPSSAIA